MQADEEVLVECRLCESKTPVTYLKNHIRFNHLINNEDLFQRLVALHDPQATASAATQTNFSWFGKEGLERSGSTDEEGETRNDLSLDTGDDKPEEGESADPCVVVEMDEAVTEAGMYKVHHQPQRGKRYQAVGEENHVGKKGREEGRKEKERGMVIEGNGRDG